MTTRSLDLNGGAGGKPVLTASDVAAGMSWMGLDRFEDAYLRARVLQSEPWHPESELAREAWMWAMDIAVDQQWTIPKGKYLIRSLAYLALDIRISWEAYRCKHCKGRGVFRPRKANWTVCRFCSGLMLDKTTGEKIGNGRRRLSARFFASRLGINHETYSATWAPRMKLLQERLMEIERRAGYLSGVVFEDEFGGGETSV